jgi:hypothetical protein
MKIILACVFGFVLCGATARAGSITSHEGGLATPESIFTTTRTLPTTEDVTLQTFGFGGGVNGHHLTIPAGGFDPLLAIFSGTGMGAAIVTDGMGSTSF